MIRVAVLAGGRSPEHDVSLQSGQQVLRHLGGRWQGWPVWLDRDGQWWPSRGPVDASEGEPAGFGEGAIGPMRPGAALCWLLEQARVEIVLPVLHGPYGEDGTVQGMLELHGVPFVGSGCAASAIAMNKIHTRECLQAHGVPMPEAYVCTTPLQRADAGSEAAVIGDRVGFPCFLKVDVSGSSLGVARCEGPAEVRDFLTGHRGMGRRYLAEALVPGCELTVAVLGNAGGSLTALPPVGIYPREDRFFTYAAKYTAARCEEVVPPRDVDGQTIRAVQDLAVQCHEVLQCDGMSRTDMIVGPAGPVVLEVNTIPGLTEVSLLPRAAAAAGLSFGALLDRLLELGLARAEADAELDIAP